MYVCSINYVIVSNNGEISKTIGRSSKRDKYGKNPFIDKVISRAEYKKIKIGENERKKLGNNEMLLVKGDEIIGEVDTAYYISKIYDPARFIKTFEGLFAVLPKLKKVGLDVFCYIMVECVEQGKDYIFFNEEHCSDKLGVQVRSVKIGINNCIDNDLIAKGLGVSMFWVNVSLFYNGKIL